MKEAEAVKFEKFKANITVDSLQEAEFKEKDGQRRIRVTIVKSGWSKNGNYWQKEAVKSIADRLIERPKIFIDHEEVKRRTGRSFHDYAARVESANVVESTDGKGNRCDAILRMTSNPATDWLYEEAKANPSDVGLSVDAKCKTRMGEAEGRKGRIVETALRMASTDFVTYASAGGKVLDIAAAEIGEEDFMILEWLDEALGNLEQTLKDKAADQKARDEHWKINSAFRDLVRDIANTSDEEATETEKKTAIKKAIDDYAVKLKTFPVPAFESELLEVLFPDTEFDNLKEVEFSDAPWDKVDKSKLPASAYLIAEDVNAKGTWHLPFKDVAGKINKGALRAISTIIQTGQFRGQKVSFPISAAVKARAIRLLKQAGIGKFALQTESEIEDPENYIIDEEVSRMNEITKEKLQAEHPEIVKSIAEDVKSQIEKDGDHAQIVEEHKTRGEKIEEQDKEIQELKTAQAKIEAEKKLAERKTYITETAKELKIPETVLTDSVLEVLEGMESEEKVKTFLEDLKGMKPAGKVDNPKAEKVAEGKEEDEKISEEDQARAFTN